MTVTKANLKSTTVPAEYQFATSGTLRILRAKSGEVKVMNQYDELKDDARRFVEYVKGQTGLTLDYSRSSINLLDSLVDQLKTLPPKERAKLTLNMAAYLGEAICRAFGGAWVNTEFNGEPYTGVKLKDRGIVSPFSWVQKRFRYGMQDSIAIKSSVLLSEQRSPRWNPEEWQTDNDLAEHFARGLGVTHSSQMTVDEFIQQLTQQYKENNMSELLSSLGNMTHAMDKNSLKYLWGRLLKLYDVTTAKFSMAPIAIRKCFQEMSPQELVYSTQEFVELTNYLRDASHAVNSDIFYILWATEKRSRFFQDADVQLRDIVLANLFQLYMRRIYFHDIKHYKKLLASIREDNVTLIKDWLTSERTVPQGCFQAIRFVRQYPLSGSRSPFGELQVKAAVIGWLDNATGREAKKSWVDKLNFIQQAVAQKDLNSICHWILHNKQFRIDKDGLGDGVFKRFYKSATWYLQHTS